MEKVRPSSPPRPLPSGRQHPSTLPGLSDGNDPECGENWNSGQRFVKRTCIVHLEGCMFTIGKAM